jgi:hypothetical protein
MEPIEMIRREMIRSHVTPTELARQLKVNPSSILGMFKRSTLQVNKLIKLSAIFQYNFFREIAGTLPYKEPVNETMIDENTIKAPLLERIKALEMEVGILRQTLKDITSR